MSNFLAIVTKPDNIPITLLLVGVVFLSWLAWNKAKKNDLRGTPIEASKDDKIQVWPYLVRVEFLAAILVLAIMVIWSVFLNAPLEAMANKSLTPNPSKAPWYFLGLQELLVYFDPWIAGVVLPSIILLGLMAIPYIDINEKGNGYYTFKERKFAILTFTFGFLILWVSLIAVGTFLRGPGWNFFWPWQVWDPHYVAVLTNADLSEYFGIPTHLPDASVNPAASFFGAVCILGYYSVIPIYWLRKRNTDLIKQLGFLRYGIVSFLLVTMIGVVIKIILRQAPLLFGLNPIKYIWVTPWFNV
jgi:hypothetical protein